MFYDKDHLRNMISLSGSDLNSNLSKCFRCYFVSALQLKAQFMPS